MTEHLSWLMGRVLPFWAEHSRDVQGGFVSDIRTDGSQVASPSRLCLVQSRNLFVFSKVQTLSPAPWALDAARHAYECLVSSFRHPDGGWAMSISGEGRVLDGTRDFYDQAFVLFGLSWWYRATKDAEALHLAEQTQEFLDAALADPQAGGYCENDKSSLPRRQNPHMHLLEALQSWFEATGDEMWLDRARKIAALFTEHFFDRDTGTLREYVAEDLSPLPPPTGALREPGHHMEWVWLLLQQRRLTGDDSLLEFQDRLFQAATRFGVNRHGLLIDEMRSDGAPVTPSSFLWPQTEAIKAYAARSLLLGEPMARADGALAAMRRLFFRDSDAVWVNRLDAEAAPLTQSTPTRVLYHLVMAVTYHAEATAALGTT